MGRLELTLLAFIPQDTYISEKSNKSTYFWHFNPRDLYNLDPNIVLGLFQYPDSSVGPDTTNEISMGRYIMIDCIILSGPIIKNQNLAITLIFYIFVLDENGHLHILAHHHVLNLIVGLLHPILYRMLQCK